MPRKLRPGRRIIRSPIAAMSTWGPIQDIHGTPLEPHNHLIQQLAREGLTKLGHHGPTSAMGVPRNELPTWDDVQILTAQMATKPLLDDAVVGTSVVIGPSAKRPLKLEIPLFVSDMSFGALSSEAKVALAKGAELAGTGICSGEGGMLAEEQEANGRYFYELASARFGWSLEKVKRCQAFHFKGGQAAKTGTGGHLPGEKVTELIAEVRGLKVGQPAISPSTFPDLSTPEDYREVADQVREATGGIPIGFKLSAQHIEADLDFALEASADYVILDGRGGATGAAPLDLPRPYFSTNPGGFASCPPSSRRLRTRRRNPDRDRRLARSGRLCESAGARGRRHRTFERSASGDWLSWDARLSHQQLSGGDRNPEEGAASASAGR